MNPNEAAEQVDVLIAGAGPTGLSTALALAPLGLRAVLADPLSFPEEIPFNRAK